MRRYLFNGDIASLPVERTDVLIIGSGIAGLYAALHIDPSLRCVVITKVDLENSNSWLAQGGIAAVISPDDKFESHIEDTLKAGAGLCDVEAVKVLVREGSENIRELVEMDVPFDTNPEGELQITREGGHSCRRIVHCGGDATGRETTRRLGEIVLERKNTDVRFRTFLIDLLTENGKAVGAVVQGAEPYVILAPNVILSTGGIGYLYNYTTNPRGSVGDGIAAAERAGAVVDNMEMVQFHPTTLYSPDNSERLFLISEAVRGEGGILKNRSGEAFMKDVHPMKDLAPRDIVTRAILAELRRSGDTNVFLDVSKMSEDFFAGRFPTIFNECRHFGINVPFDAIPVRPAQHYLMGGVRTNLDGMTAIDGLYACGECACTGIHGANRLASNSVLECLVFGRRAARHINAACRKALPDGTKPDAASHTFSERCEDRTALMQKIRDTMTEDANAIRTWSGMRRGFDIVSDIYESLQNKALTDTDDYRLYNMAQASLLVFEAALARHESVGAHYIEILHD